MENYKEEVEFTSPKHRNQVDTVSLNTLLQNERLKIITDLGQSLRHFWLRSIRFTIMKSTKNVISSS